MKLFSRKNKTERESESESESESGSGSDAGRRVVLLVDGMHCTSCGLLVDDELEDVPGVRSAATDVRAGRTLVLLHEGVDVAPAALVSAVEGAGDYTARLAD